MRVTNRSFRLTNAALVSAITLALVGCGGDNSSEEVVAPPPGGNDGGNEVTVVSVTPDYKMDLTSPVDFEGAATEATAINPDAGTFAGEVASFASKPLGTVLKTTKPVGAQPWAGTTLSDTKALDLSEELSQITVWVYSPEADIPVLLKIENANNGDEFAEVLVNTTQANQWEMLTFDFTNLNLGELNPDFVYNKKSIFFDFMSDASGKVFYWDNMRHEGKGLLDQPQPESFPVSDTGKPLLGNPEYQAISYGAWRTTERASGETVPSVEEQMEDMKILNAMGIKMVRTYNTQGFKGLDDVSNTENLLAAIHQLKQEDPNFEMYVMLGVWIDALNSWTGNTIDSSTDSPNNALEMAKAKELALAYPDIVKVIAVGNEAMVDWAASYKVHPSIILNHVNDLQNWKLESEDTSDLWITTSDNWAVWAGQDANGNNNDQADLKALIQAVDYVSLHTYAHHDTYYHPTFSKEWKVPESEQGLTKKEQIASAMDKAFVHSLEQYAAAQQFVHSVDPTKPIHIGETGWSTVSTDLYGDGGTQAADEYKQKLFHDDMRDFSDDSGVSMFFFQAFDEPWKGGDDAGHSEKHFGLVDINCNVKYLAWDKVETLNSLSLTRDCAFTASYGGNEVALMDDVLPPPFAPVEQPPAEGEFKVLGSEAFANAYGWEGTAEASIDGGVLTVTPSPTGAQSWGWGAHIGDNVTRDFSGMTKMSFEIRGSTDAGKVLAEFGFGVGFQSDKGGQWSANHAVRFNEGVYTLTTEWQTIEVNVSDFDGEPEMTKVTQPFMVHGTTNEGLTDSDIQIRNVSWFE